MSPRAADGGTRRLCTRRIRCPPPLAPSGRAAPRVDEDGYEDDDERPDVAAAVDATDNEAAAAAGDALDADEETSPP